MSRNNTGQRAKTQNNPLVLGTFSQTSLRYLHGTLGPLNKLVGYADTGQTSNGGFGGGTYNHWFQVNLTTPAWIITRKGGPRPNYIQVSAYDLNLTPMKGRMIFQKDSIETVDIDGDYFYPFFDHVMGGAGSNLYNTYDEHRLDKGNNLYFPLEAGSYLICISSTRNERLDYSLALIVEVPTDEMFLLLEDLDGSFLVAETTIDTSNTIIIGPVFASNYTLASNYNAYTFDIATINSGATVTIPETSTWLIAFTTPQSDDKFSLEGGPGYDGNNAHEHSLSEWTAAWRRERSPEDALPEIFVPLTNRP